MRIVFLISVLLTLVVGADDKFECEVEGPYNLSAIPWSTHTRPQYVEGQLGGEQIHWGVHGEERTGGYYIQSTLKGKKITWELNLRSRPQFIMGMIGEQKVILKGQNGNFRGDEACLEKTKPLLIDPNCVFEGLYNISVTPWDSNSKPQHVSGSIGNQRIGWSIRGDDPFGGYYVEEVFRGNLIRLNVNTRMNPQVIKGWAGSQWIEWTGRNGLFMGEQKCL